MTLIRGLNIANKSRSRFWKDVSIGAWEPHTFDVLDKYLGGGVFYDIGAWNGVLSLYAAKRGVRTISYEPDPVALKEFRENLSLNKDVTDLITIIPKAVGVITKDSVLSNIDAFGNSMSTIVASYDHIDGYEVEVIGIDEVFTEKPSLIKIDIEGGEFELIDKKIEVLKKQDCPIYISIHPHFGIPLNLSSIYDNFEVDMKVETAELCIKTNQGFELLLTSKP